jgi:hypothetical protein
MHTITNLKDFDPKTTIVIDGDADFECYPEITDLGNLKKIRGWAYFRDSQIQSLGNLKTIGGFAYFKNSQVQSLGNLQTIGGDANFQNSQVQCLGNLQTIGGYADFRNSQIQSLGNLQTIGGDADFGNRLDLKAEWEVKQNKTTNKMHTITDLKDFDPKTTEIIDGDANFDEFPNITNLGVLLEIRGNAEFYGSKVEDLGNLQTIGGWADFFDSQVHSLGNLQTIGDYADFESSQVSSLRNLQTIGGNAYFQDSIVEDLGNLHTIGRDAYFRDSKVENLGNLHTIGGDIYWGKTDLESVWRSRKEKSEKTFENTDSNGAKKNVSDIQFWGDGDTFKLISKAWSKSEGWMKSTKAMEIPFIGCVVQVTTQQGESVAEALTFVPNTKIIDVLNSEGVVIGRKISNINIS